LQLPGQLIALASNAKGGQGGRGDSAEIPSAGAVAPFYMTEAMQALVLGGKDQLWKEYQSKLG
jgi:hypothetical protein